MSVRKMADYCRQCSKERGHKHNDMVWSRNGICEGCGGQKFNPITGACVDPECKLHGNNFGIKKAD